MTQITISQWLSSQSTPNKGTFMPISLKKTSLPRYQIVASNRFYGCFDVLDTVTGKREACSNLRTARATVLRLNK
jgi:hypothetical protein